MNQKNNQPNLVALRQHLGRQRHRALVILSGDAVWQSEQLKNLWSNEERLWWIGPENRAIERHYFPQDYEIIETSQLLHRLGQEVDGVILDASKGLSANTLGIAAGLVKAGGLFIVCTPALEQWQTQPNPENARFLNSPLTVEQSHPYFIQHLIQQWQNPELGVVWRQSSSIQDSSNDSSRFTSSTELDRTEQRTKNITEHPLDPLESSEPLPLALRPSLETASDVTLEEKPENLLATTAIEHAMQSADDIVVGAQLVRPTHDQQQALHAIHTVAFGHRKRPLVLSADRGRGKSSVLGLAAVACLLEGKERIVLTASRLDQVKMAFKHALQAILHASTTHNIQLETQQPGLVSFTLDGQRKTLTFMAPDQLVIEPTSADLLMVDEAAHLPTAILTKLLTHHHRLVFSTTLHGYEGSGRGFENRFKKTLTERTPDWKNLHLNQPIRWAEGDPLEKAIHQALLLTPKQRLTTTPASDFVPILSDDVAFQEEPIEQLVQDSEWLHTVFELLVQAHYQTTPNDLQQLLSAPNLKIFTAKKERLLLGVLLCVEEGKIMPNSPRVHGHLVPQLLLKHYATDNFTMLSTWRVMRIAVHPSYQQQGIGKAMLQVLHTSAQKARVDYLSSSFGASNELLPFWFNQGYTPMHVGVKRDKSSGSHNVVVTLPLTAMAQQALALVQRDFQSQFPHTLIESLPYMPANRVLTILKTFRFKTQKADLSLAAAQYANGERAYESVSGKLWAWSIRHPQLLSEASELEQTVWCEKILKKQSWQTVAHQNQLPGRKGVETVMQALLTAVLPKPKVPFTQRISRSMFGRNPSS